MTDPTKVYTFPEAWLKHHFFTRGPAPGQWRRSTEDATLIYHRGVWWLMSHGGGQPARMHGIRERRDVLAQLRLMGD